MSLLEGMKPLMTPFRSAFNRLHPEGLPFVLIGFVAAIFCLLLGAETLGGVFFVLTLFVVYFFRDPARMTPVLPGAVISPADGVVTAIERTPPPEELEMSDAPMLRISIFLSVLNVHVNRIPADGRIARLVYVPGKFLNATLDKASKDNERQLVRLDRPDGSSIAFVQIAGLIARRIVCRLETGQEVRAGERFGIIRFGSRMDIYCPAGLEPRLTLGQTAIGGETVLAAPPGVAVPTEGRMS